MFNMFVLKSLYFICIEQVCGHKWSDISEFGFGVAVLNDGKYGHSAQDNVLRMSL